MTTTTIIQKTVTEFRAGGFVVRIRKNDLGHFVVTGSGRAAEYASAHTAIAVARHRLAAAVAQAERMAATSCDGLLPEVTL